MTYEGFEKRYVLSPSREAIGRSLGRNAKQAFAKHSLQSAVMRKNLILRVQLMIRAEMKRILRECTCTVKEANREDMESRSWDRHYTSVKCVAPVLVGILEACIPKNSKKREDIIVSCIAILAKSHGKLTVFHLLTSLILYSGHAGKQVNTTWLNSGLG